MKKTNVLTIFILLMTCSSLFGQKRAIDHSVYDNWKNAGAFNMTEDGRYTLFLVNAQEGDGYLVSLNLKDFTKDSIARVNSPKVTKNSKYSVFSIKPLYQQTREARIKKAKPDQMPKDTLGIYNIRTKELIKIPELRNFKVAKYATDFVAFQSHEKADTSKKSKAIKKEKDQGSDLIVYNISNKQTDTLKNVFAYDFTNGGDSLLVITRPHSKDSTNSPALYIYFPKNRSYDTLFTFNLKQTINLPFVSEDNQDLVFYANLDTADTKKEVVSILHHRRGYDRAKIIVDQSVNGLPENFRISENRALSISKDGGYLYFGVAPILPKKDTTIIESEVAKLDIWHYNEPYVQPIQLINLQRELKKSYLSRISLNDNNASMVQLAKEEYPLVRIPEEGDTNWGFSVSNYNYMIESQWSANPRNDLYIIDLNSGDSKKILEDVYISSVNSSPNGKFLIWYNNHKESWFSYTHSTGEIKSITDKIDVPLYDEDDDTPQMSYAYGNGGWAEDDKYIFIYDKYDVWRVDPTATESPIMITDGIGRKESITFRIVRLDDILLPPGTPGVKMRPLSAKETIYFSAFNNINKENGYYFKEISKRKAQMRPWIMAPYTFVYLNKDKNSNTITYVKHNFQNSPDVWVTKDFFKTEKRVTDINPQQREYNWGTAELFSWESANGDKLDGILYKPENFDPNKKYPMIVYFYEKNSHLLYFYRAPAPSRSTINIPYFVSNEYIVFVPDIVYEEGHPGKSAIDCIVPGVKKLCEYSWIDAQNIAIQGQSWGGYQVAYMVTQPETFKWKAAGAGAPVSNMTSAYGGIRWGSGMVRQFQYEHTQSRIGKNLWDGFDLYIENSPLFFANKVETPLLIMHNDNDEAVPWYQGIEYFTALRRLGKPAWMLQYNNERHNLSSRVNAKDLSIRLAQFFDHYLKGAPMPVWMKSGVPATLKGIDWGYELAE